MRVALIGNYAPDRQESMSRYAAMMQQGLAAAGHEVTVAVPRPVLNVRGRPAGGVWKWIGYVDKYVLGTSEITHAVRRADAVHVCDHSNAVYVPARSGPPHVVTCHDLLAVRGALGEDTDCPAGFSGRLLQREILEGLGRAQAVACVSSATLRDATRLLPDYRGDLVLTPNALNYPYRQLDPETLERRLAEVPGLQGIRRYILHVGSNLRRKNREGVLRAVAGIAADWDGHVVFAGQPLSAELWGLARQLRIDTRILAVAKPSDACLEALYNGALALAFPSRFEGFGWPIIEAQAAGCPVICSDRDPLPEVAGGAALLCDAEDDATLGAAITTLDRQPQARADLMRRGLQNAARYGRTALITTFVSLYERVLERS